MSILIRPFSPADAEAFRALRLEALRLHPEAFGAAFEDEAAGDAASFAASLAKPLPNLVLGAWREGDPAPVGMAGLYADRGRKLAHRGHIWGVYVRDAARRHGAARLLLLRLLEAARGGSLDVVLLSVTAGVPGPRALYESLGFAAYGTEPAALKPGPGEWRDIVLMALDLRGGSWRGGGRQCRLGGEERGGNP